MNISITDSKDAACQMKYIITEAAGIFFREKNIKTLSKSISNKKQRKRKKGFD